MSRKTPSEGEKWVKKRPYRSGEEPGKADVVLIRGFEEHEEKEHFDWSMVKYTVPGLWHPSRTRWTILGSFLYFYELVPEKTEEVNS